MLELTNSFVTSLEKVFLSFKCVVNKALGRAHTEKAL